jgi:hypothetical protein
MDGRGDRGEPVTIIGMACRFPGARDLAEFHDLAVAGRDMFQPVDAGEERRARQGGVTGGREMSGSTLASRTIPRMRAAEEAGPSGPAPAGAVSCGGAGNPARSVT